MTDEALLERMTSLIDYTRLNEEDREVDIAAFIETAKNAYGPVAAFCVYPRFVRLVRNVLHGKEIKVASVANFPSGENSIDFVLNEINSALVDGANEIDVVLPYKRYISGDKAYACDFVKRCRAMCDDKVDSNSVLLKVILECGAFNDIELLAQAARDAFASGADFIKTSTGKIAFGATLAHAKVMLEVIKDLQREPEPTRQRKLGFKVSGGIKTVEQAMTYIELAENILGRGWVSPATFRIGASKLLDDIKRCA